MIHDEFIGRRRGVSRRSEVFSVWVYGGGFAMCDGAGVTASTVRMTIWVCCYVDGGLVWEGQEYTLQNSGTFKGLEVLQAPAMDISGY
ncbi:hypothetical protein L1049_011137 [Liquidambar formosana]|uniref:Uncharacterized protein n=1 Tax=Liquidambar formosana TaxID=63359 RepID=A0AAP0RQQ9_LIQFO